MALAAANVRVGVTGEVSYAPAGSLLPTSSAGSLDSAFTGLGYNTDAGVVENINETNTVIRAWQNGDAVRTIRTEHDVQYAFTMLETTAETLETFYGDGTVNAGEVQVKAAPGRRGAWVIEVLDGTDIVRIVIPDGEVTSDGKTVSYVNGEAVSYPVTVTCYPDNNGVKAYKYYGALNGGGGGSV